MAQITTQIRKSYGMIPSLIPPDVLKKISQEELLDRLVEARKLTERARAASSPTISKGLGEMARDLLTAAPREETAREVKALLTKAARVDDPVTAQSLRARAARLEADNPAAPRRLPPQPVRAVRKTKEDPPVPVYTADGDLVGLVDPDKITRISPMAAPGAAPAEKDAAATLAAEKPLGTPKQPPSAQTPAAVGESDAVAKQRRAAAQFRALRQHPYAR